MSFEKVLPVLVACLYFATGIIHLKKGEYAACGLWLSYGVGNCFIVCLSVK